MINNLEVINNLKSVDKLTNEEFQVYLNEEYSLLWNNKNFCLEIIKKNSNALEYLRPHMLSKIEFLDQIYDFNPNFLYKTSKQFWNSFQVENIIAKNGIYFRYVGDELKTDFRLLKIAISKINHNIDFFDEIICEKFQKNNDIMKELIKINHRILEDKNLMKKINVKHQDFYDIFAFLSEDFKIYLYEKMNKNEITQEIATSMLPYKKLDDFVDYPFIEKESFILNGIRLNEDNIYYRNQKIINKSVNIVKKVIESGLINWSEIDPIHQKNKEVVLHWIKFGETDISEEIPSSVLKDKKTVIEIINKYPNIYKKLEIELKSDTDVIKTLLKKGTIFFKKLPINLQENKEFCLKIIKLLNDDKVMRFMDRNFFEDPSFVVEIIKIQPAFFFSFTKENANFYSMRKILGKNVLKEKDVLLPLENEIRLLYKKNYPSTEFNEYIELIDKFKREDELNNMITNIKEKKEERKKLKI